MLIWILPAVLALSCWGQAVGTWKLIPAKSRQTGGRLAEAITAKYESRSEAEIWTFYEVRADGSAETTSQTLRFDGKEYPCGDLGLEERPDSVISRKLESGAAEVAYKKSGRVSRRVIRTISADGKQMTLEVYVTPVEGPRVERWLVFESSGSGTEKGRTK
jgi:hypothetical protein